MSEHRQNGKFVIPIVALLSIFTGAVGGHFADRLLLEKNQATSQVKVEALEDRVETLESTKVGKPEFDVHSQFIGQLISQLREDMKEGFRRLENRIDRIPR